MNSWASGDSSNGRSTRLGSSFANSCTRIMVLRDRLWYLRRSCRGDWGLLVIVLVRKELFALCPLMLHWGLVQRLLIILCALSGSLRLRCCIGILSRILVPFLALFAFHLGLLEQPPFLRNTPTFLAVFRLVLAYQSLRGCPEDALIFTELTDPYLVLTWRMVVILGLLLHAPLTCRDSSLFGRRTSRSSRLACGLRLIGHCRTRLRSLR